AVTGRHGSGSSRINCNNARARHGAVRHLQKVAEKNASAMDTLLPQTLPCAQQDAAAACNSSICILSLRDLASLLTLPHCSSLIAFFSISVLRQCEWLLANIDIMAKVLRPSQ